MSSKGAPKDSVNSVRSVREKPIHNSQVFSFSHRRTQKNRHTKVHRDIKSTDNTERYS